MPRRRRSPSRWRCARRWRSPDKTAALVTPDRALARRVLAALARWNVPVDDSGGDALADTPAGVFARLAAEAALGRAAAGDAAGAAQASARAGFDARAVVDAGARGAARAAAASAARAGLAHALATFRDELGKLRRRNVGAASLRSAHAISTMASSMPPPIWSRSSRPRWRRWKTLPPATAAVPRHRRSASPTALSLALGGDHRRTGEGVRRDRRAPARLSIEPGDYVELFHAAIADRTVRRPEADVRVRIYGPLEARLQPVDRLVLGGLVEGVWPPETRGDPWLSRPMRHDARPRPAGAAHRAVGARLRAGARRAAR